MDLSQKINDVVKMGEQYRDLMEQVAALKRSCDSEHKRIQACIMAGESTGDPSQDCLAYLYNPSSEHYSAAKAALSVIKEMISGHNGDYVLQVQHAYDVAAVGFASLVQGEGGCLGSIVTHGQPTLGYSLSLGVLMGDKFIKQPVPSQYGTTISDVRFGLPVLRFAHWSTLGENQVRVVNLMLSPNSVNNNWHQLGQPIPKVGGIELTDPPPPILAYYVGYDAIMNWFNDYTQIPDAQIREFFAILQQPSS